MISRARHTTYVIAAAAVLALSPRPGLAAARSTRVYLTNNTPFTLALQANGLDHGIWTDPWQPPQTIAPGARVGWQSESDGVLTGTEGSLTYLINSAWQKWFTIDPPSKGHPCGPVTALWANDHHLDLFTTGPDGAILTNWWEPDKGWQKWFLPDAGQRAYPGSAVTAVWHGTHLDLFMTGYDGAVWSNWYEPDKGWQKWFMIDPQVKAHISAPVSAVWNKDHLDLFMTGTDGAIWSNWYESGKGWQTWFLVDGSQRAFPGARVTALWANDRHLDLFMTGYDGAVWTNWWEPETNWKGWFLIDPKVKANLGATVTAVWNGGHLDLFMTGSDGAVWSNGWQADTGWQTWFTIDPGLKGETGSQVTAVWANDRHLDLFINGRDGAVWSNWWEPDKSWQKWFLIDPASKASISGPVTALWSPGKTLDLFTKGTDGAVWSDNFSQQSLYIHWDNPYSGRNKYNEFVNDGFELFHTGGSGNNTEVEFTVAMSVPHRVGNFLPSIHGFPFPNKFSAVSIKQIDIPIPVGDVKVGIGDASDGLCGGMAFAVRDYFEAGVKPLGTTVAPCCIGDPLFDYLVDRLINSWGLPGGPLTYMKYMSPLYPDTDENIASPFGLVDGRAWVMAIDEWPKIKGDIDSGHLSPVGLIEIKSLLPTDLGHNHQVLIYGYELSGSTVTLHVSDPNNKGSQQDNLTLTFNRGFTDRHIEVQANPVELGPVYCFFRTDYTWHNPPR